MTTFEIEVFFDFVCEWCYITKRKLDKAIEIYHKLHPEDKDTFIFVWNPVYVNHNPHDHSVPKREALAEQEKGLDPAEREHRRKKIEQVGRSIGIEFNSEGMIGPNTRDAHRLLYFCRQARDDAINAEKELAERIMEAYHQQGKDISSKEVLREIAVAEGLNGGDVARWLATDHMERQVDQLSEHYKSVGVSVPMFLIQYKIQLMGTVGVDAFLDRFESIKRGLV